MNHGTGNSKTPGTEQQVIDFNQIRTQKLDEKRRKNERIFFKNLLSVYSVVGDSSMRPIELVNISETGLNFQVPFNPDKPWPENLDELPLRLYFSQDTYLEVRAKIVRSEPAIESNTRYVRFGCEIDTSTASYPAYQGFVKFLKLYAEQAHKDMGDVTVFYI